MLINKNKDKDMFTFYIVIKNKLYLKFKAEREGLARLWAVKVFKKDFQQTYTEKEWQELTECTIPYRSNGKLKYRKVINKYKPAKEELIKKYINCTVWENIDG